MVRTPLTYGGKDLNDGVTWFLLPGLDLGERIKTYDEVRSYSGSVAQYNVTEANFIACHVPLRVEGADASAVRTEIAALNALVDAGAQDLVHDDGSGADTYSCVESSRPTVDYSLLKSCGVAFVTFAPVRYP